MKGDFSRLLFGGSPRYSRVLHQQGRVQLDADLNEQAAIAADELQSAIRDLAGPVVSPDGGFQLEETCGLNLAGSGWFQSAAFTLGACYTLQARVCLEENAPAGPLLWKAGASGKAEFLLSIDPFGRILFQWDPPAVPPHAPRVSPDPASGLSGDVPVRSRPAAPQHVIGICVSYDGEQWALWIDDEVAAVASHKPSHPPASGALYIGRGLAPDDLFAGTLIEIQVFETARAKWETRNGWLARCGAPLAHWRMDKRNGNDLTDLSPHGLTAGFHAQADGKTPVWNSQILVKRGCLYANGRRCRNEREHFMESGPLAPHMPAAEGLHLVYIETWDREVTSWEDPSLLDAALGGADTSLRVERCWRVGLLGPLEEAARGVSSPEDLDAWQKFRFGLKCRGRLRVRRIPNASIPGNQLYRVEIHSAAGSRGGKDSASFKWSRENASVTAGVSSLDPDSKSLYLDEWPGETGVFRQGDWLEYVDDLSANTEQAYSLMKVQTVNEVDSQIIVESLPHGLVYNPSLHPRVLRWDQSADSQHLRDGAIPAVNGIWLHLECGIEIRFEGPGDLRVGDYWAFPARTLMQDVEWPRNHHGPLALDPMGVRRDCAPLALIQSSNSTLTVLQQYLKRLSPVPGSN